MTRCVVRCVLAGPHACRAHRPCVRRHADFIHDMSLSATDAAHAGQGVRLLLHVAAATTQHWLPASAVRVLCALAAVRGGSVDAAAAPAAELLLLRGLCAALGVVSRHDSTAASDPHTARAPLRQAGGSLTEALLPSRWLEAALIAPEVGATADTPARGPEESCAASRRRAIIAALVSDGAAVVAALQAARESDDARSAHVVLAAVAIAADCERLPASGYPRVLCVRRAP